MKCMSRKNSRFWLRILEFLVIGVVFGVVEDLIAIRLASGAETFWDTVAVAFWVAVPFAVFSELVVDHPNFWKRIFRLKEEEL